MTRTTAFEVSTAGVWLDAELLRPEAAHGVVLCAHAGSAFAAQDRALAEWLNQRGLASVVVDLAGPGESDPRPAAAVQAGGFDVAGGFDPTARQQPVTGAAAGQPGAAAGPPVAGAVGESVAGGAEPGLLADRLLGVLDWLTSQPDLEGLPVGLAGAGTAAPAALLVAAARTQAVRAVVCLGGRLDLAGPAVPDVAAPTLMICAEHDTAGREIAQQTRTMMEATAELRMIAGAPPSFDEPNSLAEAIEAASGWLDDHLRARVRH